MKIIHTILLTIFLFAFSSCQTIENKSQSAIKKENEKLSKFLQQPESELKIVMGEPDNIVYDDKGSKFFVYTNKKYNLKLSSFYMHRDNPQLRLAHQYTSDPTSFDYATYNADFAFVGRAPNKYAMFVGGSSSGDRLASLHKKSVLFDEIPDEIRIHLQNFVENRINQETFSEFWGRTYKKTPISNPKQFHFEEHEY